MIPLAPVLAAAVSVRCAAPVQPWASPDTSSRLLRPPALPPVAIAR